MMALREDNFRRNRVGDSFAAEYFEFDAGLCFETVRMGLVDRFAALTAMCFFVAAVGLNLLFSVKIDWEVSP